MRDQTIDQFVVTIKRYLPFFIIGAAALILIYTSYSLAASVMTKESAMFDRLEKLGDRSFDLYRSQWDLVLPMVFTWAIILFAAGFISASIVLSRGLFTRDWLKAPLATASVPAVVLNAVLLITWFNSVQLYYSKGTIDGRPFEPMVWPATLLFVVVITAICVGFTLAGALLARAALAHK